MDGEKIRLGEIAIVVRFFLRAHANGVAFGLVPEARLLNETAAGFEDADVTLDFVFEGFLEETKRVEIFDFDFGAEFFQDAR